MRGSLGASPKGQLRAKAVRQCSSVANDRHFVSKPDTESAFTRIKPRACSQGATALHVAAHQGHSHLVQALGKVKHVELNAVDNNGRTALHHAAAKGHVGVVSDLWTLGCNLELTDNLGWTGGRPCSISSAVQSRGMTALKSGRHM